MHGFYNVDKPSGLTSHDVVARIRRWSGVRQVGHGGTLDPQATGVLPIAAGHGTRLLEFLPDSKVYRAVIEFGVTTDTYDASGAVTQRRSTEGLTLDEVRQAAEQFVGTVSQRPPIYSAVHHQGARLYQLARQGVAVDVPPRMVRIDSIEVVDWTPPAIAIAVRCGRGTYMRSLAHDLGEALGCGGHLQSLTRLEDGGFRLEESVSLEELQEELTSGPPFAHLHPLEYPIQDWPALILNPGQQQAVLNGQTICPPPQGSLGRTPLWQPARCRAHSRAGNLVALLERKALDPCWHPFKVFP